MKDLFKNKKEIIIVACVIVALILVVWFVSSKSPISIAKPSGYVTLDISSGVSLGYNKEGKVIKVNNYNSQNDVKLDDVKDLSVKDALSKILEEYKDGTTMLIGIEKNDIGKGIEDYLINDYSGIDRHIIKITYIDSKDLKDNVTLGKAKLITDLKLNEEEFKNKSMEEILEYARVNELGADDYLYDLEELDGYVPRFQ